MQKEIKGNSKTVTVIAGTANIRRQDKDEEYNKEVELWNSQCCTSIKDAPSGRVASQGKLEKREQKQSEPLIIVVKEERQRR